jgi:hypothetical protein
MLRRLVGQSGAEKSINGIARLLRPRARRERPSRCAAEQRDELAAPHVEHGPAPLRRRSAAPGWLKFKNPNAPAVKRETEEGWAK